MKRRRCMDVGGGLVVGLIRAVVRIISAFGVAMFVLVGGYQYTIGGMTIGGIQAFIVYHVHVVGRFNSWRWFYASMQQVMAPAERIFSLIDEEPEIVDADGGSSRLNARRHRI